MYAPGSIKRQKTTREATRSAESSSENFHGIGRVEYKSDASYNIEENLYYRYYNASERIHGRPMEEWLRPSVFLGQAFTPGLVQRPWCEDGTSLDSYKKSIRAMFELCIKLGIKYWSGYDKNIAPEGDNFDENQSNFDQMVDLINEYQQKTGVKPLWIGVDLKTHSRYKNGAATSTDANIVTYAGYQVKKALDVAHKLNAECFLFNGEQEGYESIINTDLAKEMKHYSRFLKMIVEQRDRIGYRGQLLIQTNHENLQKNRYNFDLYSNLALLKHYNYDRYFKVNVKAGHDFFMANAYGSVGCIDIKNNDLMDVTKASLLLRTVIESGGVAPGGLTFYLPNHNAYFEAKDLAVAFVTSIDSFAKALRLAVKLVNDVQINKNIQMRYLSFASGWGAKFTGSDASFEDCEELCKKFQETNTNLNTNASRSEHWSAVLTRYIEAPLK
ncbi:PREDICTED: xylose isomerase-like [Nicrophorus vespilloides]|uniref:Xylose isomerase n=1 Tax=Nicrophorus vespilloides TaxID=110193 RepID=A0ABM1N0F1_NICVS|nr:PREDICTED: xylose isomerase-like [Nicrophorus vespilloides]